MTSFFTSLPVLCKLLEDFAQISGLCVNYSKSQALNVSLPSSLVSRLQDSFRFSWSESCIRHLGVNLTPKFEQLYQANYPPIDKKLEYDLKQWSPHHISWLGKINSVKMTLLPRLLYIFRALPIAIRKDHLSAFQNKVVKFIWGSKGHCLSRRSLFDLRTKGGLGLPNLLWYYQAARLAQISMVYAKTARPDWVEMERQAVPTYTIDFILWCTPKARPSVLSPALSKSLRIWDTLRKSPSLVSQRQTSIPHIP